MASDLGIRDPRLLWEVRLLIVRNVWLYLTVAERKDDILRIYHYLCISVDSLQYFFHCEVKEIAPWSTSETLSE